MMKLLVTITLQNTIFIPYHYLLLAKLLKPYKINFKQHSKQWFLLILTKFKFKIFKLMEKYILLLNQCKLQLIFLVLKFLKSLHITLILLRI